MKQFLKMVYTARTFGYTSRWSDDKTIIDYYEPEPITNNFYSLVEGSSVFVFPNKPLSTDYINSPEELDLPFKTCAFECFDKTNHQYKCWLINEIAPKEYEFFVLVNDGVKDAIIYDLNGPSYALFKTHAQSFLSQIKYGKTGIENTNIPVKLGSGKNKYTHKIRKIVHICNEKEYLKTKSITGKPIDWSHRWSVRGHWRRIIGLGKDRNGDYSVANFTWVTDHIRGPEELPFIKKTRFLKTERKNNEYRANNTTIQKNQSTSAIY